MSSATPRLRRELSRFSKFTIVGLIGAVVDFGTFNLLSQWIGIVEIAAQAISFSAAVTSNFLWNRYWTYPDSRAKTPARQAAQFALVNMVGLAIRTPLFVLVQGPMARFAGVVIQGWGKSLPQAARAMLPADAAILGSNLALALAVIVVLFWNFGVNRLWTYSDAP